MLKAGKVWNKKKTCSTSALTFLHLLKAKKPSGEILYKASIRSRYPSKFANVIFVESMSGKRVFSGPFASAHCKKEDDGKCFLTTP